MPRRVLLSLVLILAFAVAGCGSIGPQDPAAQKAAPLVAAVQQTVVPDQPAQARQQPSGNTSGQQSVPSRPQAVDPTQTPVPAPTQTPTGLTIVAPTPVPAVAELCAPVTMKQVTGARVVADNIRVAGVPTATNVDIARGQFSNPLGLGTEAFLAKPGALLVGPDFFDRQASNPLGRNGNGADTMYSSEGSIRPFSPVSQRTPGECGPWFGPVPEGGFVKFTGGEMLVQITDGAGAVRTTIDLPRLGADHNWFFYVRGLYPPSAPAPQNSNRNLVARLLGYVPGNTLFHMYQSRDKTNAAFVDHEQFFQEVIVSQGGGPNCGAGGCGRLTAVFLDTNTGAMTIITRTGNQGNLRDASGWTQKFKNF